MKRRLAIIVATASLIGGAWMVPARAATVTPAHVTSVAPAASRSSPWACLAILQLNIGLCQSSPV
jgi:hypothetical protein